mmetsp:Transcript_36718/g.63361  ORF Transcript_36718/g.63361 Transcript_36718/m.63361 type:complete len:347 (-) Transcript_36718:389-1429(-)
MTRMRPLDLLSSPPPPPPPAASTPPRQVPTLLVADLLVRKSSSPRRQTSPLLPPWHLQPWRPLRQSLLWLPSPLPPLRRHSRSPLQLLSLPRPPPLLRHRALRPAPPSTSNALSTRTKRRVMLPRRQHLLRSHPVYQQQHRRPPRSHPASQPLHHVRRRNALCLPSRSPRLLRRRLMHSHQRSPLQHSRRDNLCLCRSLPLLLRERPRRNVPRPLPRRWTCWTCLCLRLSMHHQRHLTLLVATPSCRLSREPAPLLLHLRSPPRLILSLLLSLPAPRQLSTPLPRPPRTTHLPRPCRKRRSQSPSHSRITMPSLRPLLDGPPAAARRHCLRHHRLMTLLPACLPLR